MIDWLVYITIGAQLVLLAMVLIVIKTNRLQQNRIEQLERQVTEMSTTFQQLLAQQNESLASHQAMGKQIKSLQSLEDNVEQQINAYRTEINEQLDQLKQDNPADRLYSHAAKLVDKGATVEEVMRETNLPRAEAELLLRIKGR